MTPIEKIWKWFEGQNEIQRDNAVFEVLYFAPDYDMGQYGSSLSTYEVFIKYLTFDLSMKQNVGKTLYVKNAIDFIVNGYDNDDSLMNSQSKTKNAISQHEIEEIN
jgi:hypothetical protein